VNQFGAIMRQRKAALKWADFHAWRWADGATLRTAGAYRICHWHIPGCLYLRTGAMCPREIACPRAGDWSGRRPARGAPATARVVDDARARRFAQPPGCFRDSEPERGHAISRLHTGMRTVPSPGARRSTGMAGNARPVRPIAPARVRLRYRPGLGCRHRGRRARSAGGGLKFSAAGSDNATTAVLHASR
jgi:hypothetical protein